MKRTIATGLVALLLISSFSFNGFSANASILEDDFESYTAGGEMPISDKWDMIRLKSVIPQGLITVENEGTNKVCQIGIDSTGISGWTQHYIGKTGLDLTSGKFVMEAKVKAPSGMTANDRIEATLQLEESTSGVVWRFTNGRIYVGNGGGNYQQIQSYAVDKWYTIQLVVDCNAKKITVTAVDEAGGMKKGEMGAVDTFNFKAATNGNITFRCWANGDTGTKTMRFDNVKMYYGEPNPMAGTASTPATKPAVTPTATAKPDLPGGIQNTGAGLPGTQNITLTTELTDILADRNVGAIAYLENKGILNGYGDGTYQPNLAMTRAEFTSLLMRYFYSSMKRDIVKYSIFDDVRNNHWAMPDISLAAAVGIIKGKSGNLFDPEAPITFAEAVKMVVVAKNLEADAEKNGGYPSGYIAVANAKGLLNNVGGEEEDSIRRGAIAQLLFNVEFPVISQVNITVTTKSESQAQTTETIEQPSIPVPSAQPDAKPIGTFPTIIGGKVFIGADYGINGSDDKDDTEGFAKLTAAVSAEKENVTIQLEKGKYYVQDVPVAMQFNAFNNLVIDGQGSDLIVRSDAMRPIFFNGCKNVLLKNISIYWEKCYISQGEVIASTPNSLDIKFPPHYPVNEKIDIQGMMDYDPITRMPIANIDVNGKGAFQSIELIGVQTLRITFKSQWGTDEKNQYVSDVLKNMPKGTLILIRHAVYGQYAVDIEEGENIMLENVNIYHVPGMAVHATRINNYYLKNVKVVPMPGTDRVLSSTADAMMTMFPSGEMIVEGCTIESSGDDCLPINGKVMDIADVNYATKSIDFTIAVGWEGPVARPGDKIQFYNSSTLESLGTCTVLSSTFDKEAKKHKTIFAEPLPEGLEFGDAAYNMNYTTTSLVVKNTSLGGNMRRATILSAENVYFENVRIHDSGLPGAMLWGSNTLSHHPGPSCVNLTFKNCTFENMAQASLYSFVGSSTPGMAQKNINVIDCKFIDNKNITPYNASKHRYYMHPEVQFMQAAIMFKDIDKGEISGNTFSGFTSPITIYNCKDIVVKNNTVLDEAPQPLVIDQKTCINVTQQDNSNFKLVDSAEGLKVNFLYYNDMR